MSPTYKEFRDVMYKYHLEGLDHMNSDAKKAKTAISLALTDLETMNRRRPNSFILRVFFDAKSDEIQEVFSGGPSVNISNLISTLTRIAPMHSNKWRKISF
jgi:hypothetical protein